MPQIYSNSDLALIPLGAKEFTCPVNTLGIIITNYSDVPFLLSNQNSEDLGIILPYFSRSYQAGVGDKFTLTPQSLLNAQAFPNMFVNVDFSQAAIVPSIIPLSQVNGYQMNVTGTVDIGSIPSVSIYGTPTVAISGTPSIAVAGNVDIGSMPAVNLAAGTTMNATIENIAQVDITNSVINTQAVTNQMTAFNVGANVTNQTILAAGSFIHAIVLQVDSYTGGYVGRASLYNGGGQFFKGSSTTTGSNGASVTVQYSLSFGNGVPNNGITISTDSYGEATGYIIHD